MFPKQKIPLLLVFLMNDSQLPISKKCIILERQLGLHKGMELLRSVYMLQKRENPQAIGSGSESKEGAVKTLRETESEDTKFRKNSQCVGMRDNFVGVTLNIYK